MKIVRLLSIVIILFAVGALLIFKFTVIYVPVGMVGVRTQEYPIFGKAGVVQEDFKPGYHRNLGPIDSWQLFDSTAQALIMTRDAESGSVKGRDDIRVQSADGYSVSVDMTIKYRIQDGMAHKLYQDTGGGDKYKTIVRTESQQACIAFFGQMKTEEFYNPAERRKRAEQVKIRLSESLTDNFVEVVDVLIRDVQFDPEYEKKIQMKKLADQEVEVNKSMAKAAEKRGMTQVIEAETARMVKVISEQRAAALVEMEATADRDIARIKADYEKYATEKQADADLVAAQKGAEGQLLVKKAEAEGESLRNLAMTGVGGSTMVALEAARNLNLGDITISTVDVDLLDIDKMAAKLGAAPAK
jgi:regulator of protease activity HflC (stomatin/prohibitin superfamily)